MYEAIETSLKGCIKLIPKVFEDNRGISIKIYHKDEYKKMGIKEDFVEDLIVVSNKDVLRGLHFQNPPYGQAKLIFCMKGKVMDVVLDIRKGSPSYGMYELFELSEENKHILYVPEGFAHGYISLQDETILMYKMSSLYMPAYESGIKWDSLGIPWMIKKPIISERDKSFISFKDFNSNFVYQD